MDFPTPDHLLETSNDPLWFKDAVIYQLHVKAFADSNNDGIGDFPGLTRKLDYLKELGVNVLWLLPFYKSPGRDDGYDIADYTSINPDFGTIEDFKQFVGEAHRLGMRVITELVINHTSDQHKWFQRARRSPPNSNARNWYVWSDTDQKFPETRIIFTDTEKSNWAWDDTAKAYYWHRFFSHQPDLNFDNPRVLQAIVGVMKRWLDMGVDGFRLDAVPYLIEREGTNNENLPETHAVIKTLRRELDRHASNKILLAEANQWPEDVQQYFGDGDECHMAYHFPLMPRIYMAIAQEDRFPITDIMRQTPDIPENCQWAMFLRNHDELTLEMVTDAERDYLWSTYAADPRARINLGIRRRLAPLMDNDRRKIELMNSILLSMPGTPVLYYGDEIGMGDNIYLGDRNGVRTPMQWTPDRNGGFSKADPARLYLPAVMDPIYGFGAVNVEAQSQSASSLLNWMKRLIALRAGSKAFGRGTLTFVRPKNRTVLAYIREFEDESVLCVCNMSRAAQAVELDLRAWEARIPQEMLGRTRFPAIGELPYLVTLPPYGFYWFKLHAAVQEQETASLAREVLTLVVRNQNWLSVFSERNRNVLELDVLPNYLCQRRWFKGDGNQPPVTLAAVIPFEPEKAKFAFLIVDVPNDSEADRYFLPVRIEWEHYTKLDHGPGKVLAAVRQISREGSLVDAADCPSLFSLILAHIAQGSVLKSDGTTLHFHRMAGFPELAATQNVRVLTAEQSNTSVVIDDKLIVKLLRKVVAGTHPEIEIGEFLSETSFGGTPPLLGSVVVYTKNEPTALAVVHAFVENQGDGWTVIGNLLDRVFDEFHLAGTDKLALPPDHSVLSERIRQIGARTAEFHLALASRPEVPDFAPEPLSNEDSAKWADALAARFEKVIAALTKSKLPGGASAAAALLLHHQHAIQEYIGKSGDARFEGAKIRHHGDYHLGQILIVSDGVLLLDFEGEPLRSLAERRRKAPPARDIAGMMRSIDYALQAALRRASDDQADERLRDFSNALRSDLVDTFWQSYRALTSESRIWPREEEAAQELISFFMLEKVFYEIEYEIGYRPEWAHIPLSAAVSILRFRGVIDDAQ